MTTIVILGASALQRPLIRAARAVGCRVVSVDNIPANIGHRDADQSYDVSTRDVEGVVEIARREGAAAILTCCSDVALPAVAAANDALGLSGFSTSVLDCWFPKNRLRRFQGECGLTHPDFVQGKPGARLLEGARKIASPVVVKPSDRSGSRGVVRIASENAHALESAIDSAARIGFAGDVVVEKFIDGLEYGGDAWVQDGEVVAAFITAKSMQGAVVRGHRHPSGLSVEHESLLVAALQGHVTAARYRSGPVNFDVRMANGAVPFVLEVAPRLGGNWIPQLVGFSWGVDLFSAVVRDALGESVGIEARKSRVGASHVLASAETSELLEPVPIAEIIEGIPSLVDLEIDLEVGDPMAPMQDSAQQIGRALFDLEKQDYAEAVEALGSALEPWNPLCATDEEEGAAS